MLVFSREHRHQKLHVGKLRADTLQRSDVSFAHSVPSGSESRVYSTAYTDHQCQRKTMFSSSWHDHFLEQLSTIIVGWILEIIRKRNCHVDRPHSQDPLVQESAQFIKGARREIGANIEVLDLEHINGRGPFVKQRVQPKRCVKAIVRSESGLPCLNFLLAKGIV